MRGSQQFGKCYFEWGKITHPSGWITEGYVVHADWCEHDGFVIGDVVEDMLNKKLRQLRKEIG